jgi:hypothetical protein
MLLERATKKQNLQDRLVGCDVARAACSRHEQLLRAQLFFE